MTRSANFGVVIIGKNEGERLKRCLGAVQRTAAVAVVYVDSGSSDGSVEWATRMGVDVVELNLAIPFTAARARNAGFARLCERAADPEFVQFIDGDCELSLDWPHDALSFLADRDDVCAVFGRRRERCPEISIYNALCDAEWNVPVGIARSFGGDVMMRTAALREVGGYRDDLIAGEEPELCIRLRRRGWRIWRIDHDMTIHDAAMTRFRQWWKRSVRSGHAFAQGAYLHGASSERHWVWETLRALIWAVAIPVACVFATIYFFPWGAVTWMIFPLQIARRARASGGGVSARFKRASLETLVRFAEAQGIFRFLGNRVFRRQSALIEYK